MVAYLGTAIMNYISEQKFLLLQCVLVGIPSSTPCPKNVPSLACYITFTHMNEFFWQKCYQ